MRRKQGGEEGRRVIVSSLAEGVIRSSSFKKQLCIDAKSLESAGMEMYRAKAEF